MYLPPAFEEKRFDAMRALVEAAPLASVVTFRGERL